jgi:hypothetical protein
VTPSDKTPTRGGGWRPGADARLVGASGLRRDLSGYVRRLDRVWSPGPDQGRGRWPEPCSFLPSEPDIDP